MIIRSALFLFFLLHSVWLCAQTGQLTGKVLDSQTSEPLPFCNVFINNSTIGTAANDKGEFTLKNIPAGNQEIVFSFVGYESYQTKVIIALGETLQLTIKLRPDEKQLAEVEVKGTRDKKWEKQLKKFKRIFLGEDAIGSSCKITNPWVIEFTENENMLTAKASAPIEIENLGMGYHLNYYLKSFKFDGNTYSIVGNTHFDELLTADASQAIKWMKNREDVYQGSPRHLFKSILENDVIAQGFRLYTDKTSKNVIRSSNFSAELNEKGNVIPYKTDNIVSRGSTLYEYKIQLKDRIEVHFVNENAKAAVYKDVFHSVSWIEVKNNFARVSGDGVLLNSTEVVISGDMGYNRIGSLLPMDYQTNKIIHVQMSESQLRVRRFQEKVYVQTDKPYYYPGETIWFKAYMSYRYPQMRDTLSQVLYVDLISPDHKIARSSILHIDSGRVEGSLMIPANFSKGMYVMRAYTNWIRNYGPSQFFTKPLPVLDLNEKVDLTATEGHSIPQSDLKIKADKPSYGPRDKIRLSFELIDENDEPLEAEVSISVTDSKQVVPMNEPVSISRNYLMDDEYSKDMLREFRYPIERGVHFSGQYLNGKGKPELMNITVIQEKFENMFNLTTNAKGEFKLTDLQISDTVEFAFQAKKTQGLPGKVIEGRPDFPPAEVGFVGYSLPISKVESVQRVLSSYEIPSDAILLNEVEVKDTRIAEVTYRNPYGKPEYSIKGEDLVKFGGSVASAFQGKIPGFKLIFSESHWYIVRMRGEITSGSQFISPIPVNGPNTATGGGTITSVNSPSEPMVMIDNVQVILGSSETMGDRLQAMNGTMIDRIEVTSLVGSQLGALGANGLISIYTNAAENKPTNFKSLPILKVRGYDKPRKFRAPDYDDPTSSLQADYRSTLYWNPVVQLNKKGKSNEVTFFASDMTGKYRVVVEGITKEGKPVHAETFISVEY